ncbi:MarR family winged helix-turn-helix transcriptional regulator [Frondihabitans australicus]|uniref:DNA-binding MarR family transcriptional regulator n=1 Tax=Frondihabitans australicus TaxID=386892 RepID=A0A495IA91_9MICO|nr:MarR family winged helix-turn-helix transcriptional regulator [Frondihabitans australicus]RKR72929.1 DNA-binding MarR family transcriptional regulator [Frondihabitans australicus]
MTIPVPVPEPADETPTPRDEQLTRESPVVQAVAAATAAADAAHRRLRTVFAASVGLSPLEFNALMHVGAVADLTPKALAAHLDITTGAVTAMTDRLVGAGLVEREPNPNDRRSLLLALTATGARARQSMIDQYHDAIARALESSPDVRIERLVAVLDNTASAIGETSDAIEGTPTIHPR